MEIDPANLDWPTVTYSVLVGLAADGVPEAIAELALRDAAAD